MSSGLCLSILLDIFIMVLTVIPIGIFKFFVTPQQRGYFCDDESLRYPFRSSTVNNIMLDLIAVVFPILLMTAVEWFRIVRYEPRKYEIPTSRVVLFGYRLHPLVVRVYFFVGYFMFGAAMNQTLTDIGKYTVGRLRPHFIDVCKPDVVNCVGHDYITDFKCTTEERYELRDVRLSFPSGHSSLSFYAMLYTAIFIQARVSWRLRNRLTKPFIQFVLMCVALAIALSRISDYKHHWSDVLAGSILGMSVSLVLTFGIMKVFALDRYLGYTAYSGKGNNRDAVDMQDLEQVSAH